MAGNRTRIFILYEDFAVGTAAKEMCDHWIGEAVSADRADRIMWKFEAVRSPPLQALMLADMVEANIVVVAAEEGMALPLEVRHWLESALTRKTGGALVALLRRREGSDPRTNPVRSYLSVLAGQTGFDFHGPGEALLLPGFTEPVQIVAPQREAASGLSPLPP